MTRPFSKKQKKAWYVHHQGKQVRLGKTEVEAMQQWQRLAANNEPAPSILVQAFGDDVPVTIAIVLTIAQQPPFTAPRRAASPRQSRLAPP